RRMIGEFANSWGVGFDIGFQYEKNDWMLGLMLRDITTTYHIWNINEDEFEKIAGAIPGQNQDLPETTEITLPKAQFGLARKFIIRYDYSIFASANLNMRFAQIGRASCSESASIQEFFEV